jgi:hypothetical protein
MATATIGGMDTVSTDGAAICNCRTANIRAATGGGRRLLFGFAVVRPGERRLAVRAIFFEIGKHEVVPCQQPITFAESRGRRILSRQLAFGRPSIDNAAPPLCGQPFARPANRTTDELARRIGDGSSRLVDKRAVTSK